MRTVFHGRLVNGPTGDPSVYVDVPDARRAILFDAGDLSALSAREILRVSDLFVSHTHVDHWIGFDRFIRTCIGRDTHLRVFGPAGFIEQVACKLAAYTWNLVARYDAVFTILAVELVDTRTARVCEMSSEHGFHPGPVRQVRCRDGLLLDDLWLRVRASILDHRTPCLAFALEEKGHLGVRKTELERLGLPVGDWLRDLKNAVRRGAPGETIFRIDWHDDEGQEREKFFPLSVLVSCLHRAPGQKLCYVVDTRYDDGNVERILDLIDGADQLFIETPFLHVDAERAYERYHLTARQAGVLARRGRVQKLIPMHFSARHDGEEAALVEEARAAHRNEIEPGDVSG